MESVILKFILDNQGAVDADYLTCNLGSGDAIDDIIRNQERFALCCPFGQQKVVARTRLKMCRVIACPGPCNKLHLCKKFLFTGNCPFSTRCKFSHQLDSDYNMALLTEHKLESLSRTELRTLLLQTDNFLLPDICHNFNNGGGEFGLCGDGYDCKRMHMCERYMNRDCSCSKPHDFTSSQPYKCLHERNVPDDLIPSLRAVYANIMALKYIDRKSADNGLDPERGQWNRRGGGQRGNRDKTEICMFFIKGHCKHDEQCFKVHDKMPYKWEVREGDRWAALPENEAIEKHYCDPKNTYSTGSPPVHFDTMTRGSDKVRRLSTTNSVLEPTYLHTTEWVWYWEDECGKWTVYASAAAGQKAANMDSATLELRFLANDKDVVDFTAGSQSYSLSFPDMIQTNKHYGTKRPVKRRPQFVSANDVLTRRVRRPQIITGVPDSWDKKQIPPTGFMRVPLLRSLDEFKELETLFRQSLRGFDIVKIERIQNKALWELFQWQKNQMKNNNHGRNVTEKQLFHGTDSKYVDVICHTNFDWRVCGVNGTVFGQGSYFARDAKYSHSYTGDADVKSMFISRVLVGHYTKGHSSYRRPPAKDGGDINFFDSCVDDVMNPSIFVVFDKPQIYPEYLLQYKATQSSVTTMYPAAPAPVARPVPTPVPTPVPRPVPTPLPRPAHQPTYSTNFSLSSSPTYRSSSYSYTPPPLSYSPPTRRVPRRTPSPPTPPKKNDSCVIA
ncbi:protein mono-ADP-ribosyltransferase PARP12 isoform X2 [Clinocottus analis]|uniref:protein mono-ADP-ribosyltransferase PARP12 isoform X2 n=1 Tax=Clinocottus analis TaxID=304258 RepID=UPI0035BFCAE8